MLIIHAFRDLHEKERLTLEAREMMSQVINTKALLMGFIQLPIFLSFFATLRRMAYTNPEFATGGIGLFHNLTEATPIAPLVTITTFIGSMIVSNINKTLLTHFLLLSYLLTVFS